MTAAATIGRRVLLAGFGLANQAVAAALVERGHEVAVTDDRPGDAALAAAGRLGIDVTAAPSAADLDALLDGADALVATPGLPEQHPVFAGAAARALPSLSEFDLAAAWDDRPIVAITGTDGKTTVTDMVHAMLGAAGIRAVEAGNNDLPLVAAIADPDPEWFVVEASSFRLARTNGWAPRVGTWLNFAEDHLDVHADMAAYAAAKARIWAFQGPDDVAIGNADDPVVARYLHAAPGRQVGFSAKDHPRTAQAPPFHRRQQLLCLGDRATAYQVARLPRRLPHDLANALAAAATATACGADLDAVRTTLDTFGPLPHRLFPVASVGGVTYYDDSKATVPHATVSAVSSFGSAVLIAGGRNKGLDLSALATVAGHLRHVVAIGDAAAEVVDAFAGLVPTTTATSMADAVRIAAANAHTGDAVVLSPACASFDWYRNYAERGDDFAAEVRTLTPPEDSG